MNRSGSMSIDVNVVDSDDSDVDDVVKKNLMPYLDERSVKAEKEYVKVFLRIRPFTRAEEGKDENQGCIEVENEKTVIVQAPRESNAHRSAQYGLAKPAQMFTFSKVFGDNTTQKTFFDETMLSTVKDFINGENCLVFSYGVTNSGKTYTIQGDPSDSGVLPRSLDVVFNSIDGRIYDRMDLKPNMYCSVVRLSPEQEADEIALKESIMKLTFDDKGFCPVADATESLHATSDGLSNHPEHDGTIDEISTAVANRRREEATIDVRSQGHIRFSIWISFVEIYNEQIFDLLVPVSRRKTDRRPILNLREDKNKNPYVKDLRQINVSSADEAYRLLALGRRNLKVASTKLNQSSSRSHCIFSIKMIRVVDTDQPHIARISMLSVCDLAGSERHQKTESVGDRLKEATNINTSLLTLGRCITALRNKQNNRNPDRQQVVPFRESQLTRLFSAYLTGKGRASMIVNVNQCASIFDETLNCLRYSAIAKQVIVRESEVPKPVAREMRSSVLKVPLVKVPLRKPSMARSRATVGWASPGTYQKMIEAGEISVCTDRLSSATEDDETMDGEDEDEEEECRTVTERNPEWPRERAILLGVIKQLKEKLEAEMNARDALEVKIRAEVCEEMKTQLVIIENNYQESLRLREEINEEKLERKLEILSEAMQKPKKRRLDNEDEECVPKHLLDAEISKVQKHSNRIEELEDEVNSLKRELKEVKANFSQASKERECFAQEATKAQFSASDAKRQLDDVKKKLSESGALVVSLNKQIESLREVNETQRLSLSNLTSVNRNLEERTKLMESELEDCRKRLTFIDEVSRQLKGNCGFNSQLEVKDATVSKLSASSFCKKSRLANGQQPTGVALEDADDQADVSQMEFDNMANQNLKEVTSYSSDGTRLRSAHRKSRQPRAIENVDPAALEQDKSSDILQYRDGNMSSAMKGCSGGDRSPPFKSPSRSLNRGKRCRKVLSNIDEQLTTSLAEDNCQEVTAQIPHDFVIRKLRSRKP